MPDWRLPLGWWVWCVIPEPVTPSTPKTHLSQLCPFPHLLPYPRLDWHLSPSHWALPLFSWLITTPLGLIWASLLVPWTRSDQPCSKKRVLTNCISPGLELKVLTLQHWGCCLGFQQVPAQRTRCKCKMAPSAPNSRIPGFFHVTAISCLFPPWSLFPFSENRRSLSSISRSSTNLFCPRGLHQLSVTAWNYRKMQPLQSKLKASSPPPADCPSSHYMISSHIILLPIVLFRAKI